MPRPIFASLLIFAGATASFAQPPGQFPYGGPVAPVMPQSPEPPLADGSPTPSGIQQTSAAAPGVSSPTPVVVVRVRAPAFVPVSKEIPYRIQVENTSSLPAYEVTVTFPIPKNSKLLKADPPEQ